jgi:hypothetical protein
MDEIKFLNLEELKKIFGDKKLDDKEFTKSELINAQIEKPVELDKVAFSFGASSNFNVQLFNSPDDDDEDGVIGKNSTNIIQPAPGELWLKYQVKSGLKSTAGMELNELGFDFSGEKSLVFNAYRVHKDANKTIKDAVTNNFSPFLFAANANHLKANKLQSGEVLAIYLPGKLSLSISISWADVFTGNLAALEKLLASNNVFTLEIGANAKVDFSVDIKDDFSLVIRRNTNNTYEVYVKKSLSRQIAGNFAASIGVAFKDPNVVKKVAGKVAEGLIQELRDKVQPILDKNPAQKLSSTEKEIAKKADGILGFDAETIETVANFEFALTEKLGKVIEQIAISKIQAGFAYEYKRLQTESVLLQVELTQAALQRYHKALIRFKLEDYKGMDGAVSKGILSDIRNGQADGVTLKDYLKEKTIQRSQAWGFTLGIGKWTLKGIDNKEIKEITRENFQKHRQVAFEGVRAYQGKLFGSEHNWRVDFNAEMDRFSQRPMPLANELKYSLFLEEEWQHRILKKDTLRDIIDQAVLWKVISQDQFESVHSQLAEVLIKSNAEDIQTSIQLKINPDTFITIVGNIYHLINHKPLFNTKIIAQALGAAMSYLPDFPVRRTVESRTNLYGPLWEMCLVKSNKTENHSIIEQHEIVNLAFTAQERLKKVGENLLADQEPKNTNSPDGKYFSGLLHSNRNTRVDWGHFKNGLVRLYGGFSQGLIYDEVVKNSFKDMQLFWQQGLYVRALGYYLLHFAQNNLLMSGVDRSLTVAYKINGEEKVLNVIGKI